MARLSLPVVLIGPMGAGKTRVGMRLAASVGASFIDTDARIVERYGPIPEIFAERGEPGFRELEREVVAEALHEDAVVSLGGGAVLDLDTRRDLAELPVVWLRVTPQAVASRLAGGGRPLLVDGGIEAWRRINAEREPVYASLADLTIDTSRRSVARIVADITGRFGDHE
ncbi:shikimate kinase [Agromyces intestinalis]|uniref:shikimate kinase n=1 Tax=Agromyces intestinalis TaxID=2592652 RepID=UPI00319DB9B8